MQTRKYLVGLCALVLIILAACAPAPTATPVPPMATPVPPTVAPTQAPTTAPTTAPTVAPTATVVPPTATSVPAAFPLTLTDDAGRSVTLQAAPKRVVSLAPSNTEAVYALGKGDLLVGVTEYCDYPPEAKQKPKIGGYTKIDLEKVVGLTPDLVLATNIHVKTIVPELEKRGLTVFAIEPQSVSEVIAKLATFGKLLDANDQASKLTAQLKSRMDAVTSKVATAKTKPRVFYEIDKTLYTAGPGSFIDDLLVKAGANNIASDAKSQYPQLSPEVVIAKDPEVILLGDMNYGETPEQVKARPGWANITAVKTNRVIPITDENLIARPGPRIIDGLELIARAVYPELFK